MTASTLINLDFSGTFSSDFDKGTGSYAAYSSGTLVISGHGLVLAKTSCGTGDKWMRFTMPTFTSDQESVGVACGDGSGTALLAIFSRETATLNGKLSQMAAFTAYITEGTDYSPVSTPITWVNPTTVPYGISFEASTGIIRFWVNPTAATPSAVNSWDGIDATCQFVSPVTFTTFSRLGFGSWDTTPQANAFDNFTGGNFGGGGGPSIAVLASSYLQHQT